MKVFLLRKISQIVKSVKNFFIKKGKNANWCERIEWNNISEEKTDLAYDNAMKFLEDLDNSQKNIDSKALVFLSYLFTICGILLYNILFKDDALNKISLQRGTLFECAIMLCLGYSILFCFTAMIFLSTQRRQNRYAAPVDIFGSSSNCVQHIKNDLCLGLNEAISFNLVKQNRRAFTLKILLLISVIFPIGLISYCLSGITIFWIFLDSTIALVFLWFLFRFYP